MATPSLSRVLVRQGQFWKRPLWWPDRTGNPIWSPGKPSDDDMSHGQCEKRKTKNKCFDDCVGNAINDPKRPQFGIGPQATDCQEWSEDTLESCSKKCDVWRLYDK